MMFVNRNILVNALSKCNGKWKRDMNNVVFSRWIGIVALGLAAVSAVSAAPGQNANGVPDSLMKKLTRGVNITHWFGYVDPTDTNAMKSYLVEDDLQAFKKINLGFVRLCVSPGVIYRNGAPDPTNLPLVDTGIDKLENAGLAVLWDLHDNGEMKLDAPNQDNSGFVRFWEALAQHYKGRHERTLVFELVNEPIFQQNPEVWYKLQQQTVEAVRKIDRARTILVSSSGWNGIDTLAAMKPLPEKNLIYSFHCYDPFLYTHQGATWTGEQQKAMRDIPFPSSPEAVAAMIDKIPEQYRDSVRSYGEQRLGKPYLQSRLEKAKNWAVENKVPVLLGEFGSYPLVAPKDARARWFDAMREVIGDLGLPNAIWGYDDSFGLGREKSADGKVNLDSLTLEHFFQAP